MSFASHFRRGKDNTAADQRSNASQKSRDGSRSGSVTNTADLSVDLAHDESAAPYPADIRMSRYQQQHQQQQQYPYTREATRYFTLLQSVRPS